MNLTKSELKLFENILNKYGSNDFFEEEYSYSYTIYKNLIKKNILIFEIFLINNELVTKYKISESFYKKYIRSKKLSNFISPS